FSADLLSIIVPTPRLPPPASARAPFRRCTIPPSGKIAARPPPPLPSPPRATLSTFRPQVPPTPHKHTSQLLLFSNSSLVLSIAPRLCDNSTVNLPDAARVRDRTVTNWQGNAHSACILRHASGAGNHRPMSHPCWEVT